MKTLFKITVSIVCLLTLVSTVLAQIDHEQTDLVTQAGALRLMDIISEGNIQTDHFSEPYLQIGRQVFMPENLEMVRSNKYAVAEYGRGQRAVDRINQIVEEKYLRGLELDNARSEDDPATLFAFSAKEDIFNVIETKTLDKEYIAMMFPSEKVGVEIYKTRLGEMSAACHFFLQDGRTKVILLEDDETNKFEAFQNIWREYTSPGENMTSDFNGFVAPEFGIYISGSIPEMSSTLVEGYPINQFNHLVDVKFKPSMHIKIGTSAAVAKGAASHYIQEIEGYYWFIENNFSFLVVDTLANVPLVFLQITKASWLPSY